MICLIKKFPMIIFQFFKGWKTGEKNSRKTVENCIVCLLAMYFNNTQALSSAPASACISINSFISLLIAIISSRQCSG